MTLGRLWAGRAYGTNTGNVFVKLNGEDEALTGTLHLNEPGVGLVVYSVQGAFDGHQLILTGEPQTEIEGVVFGQLSAAANLDTRGELNGEWNTNIGSAGTFTLFPHDQAQDLEADASKFPDQLHTARHQFGAVAVDREQITTIAEEIQRDFKKSQVIVTVVAGTEQSRFLSDFKAFNFNTDRAAIIRMFVQEPEGSGVNRVVQVEFGPQVNTAMTQGGEESWVLGTLEKLKRSIQPFERNYATNFKKFGFGINQLLVVGAVIFLPSLGSLQDRTVLMTGVLALTFGVNWLHNRYLPLAALYLGEKPKGILARLSPSVLSWFIATTAGIVALLLGSYLLGLLPTPPTGQ